MYSESDLDAAVKGGALSAEAAESFRSFIARSRSTRGADEESFRLLTGFNDIFVTIAIVLVFAAAAALVPEQASLAEGPVLAAASWGLAEYFTRRRRMALPSIVLVLIFVGSVFLTGFLPLQAAFRAGALPGGGPEGRPLLAGFAALALAAGAAYAHWRRFMVPITVAAMTLAVVGAVLLILFAAVPEARDMRLPLIFATGLVVFAVAMRWDGSDRRRVTRRADTAFWLHLAAAPMIVHPVFQGLHLLAPGVPVLNAVFAVACYVLLILVALAVDRRALLVSSLAYVLVAMSRLLSGNGAVTSAFAVAALCIGTCLLLLSASWQSGRSLLVGRLPPALQALLPPVG